MEKCQGSVCFIIEGGKRRKHCFFLTFLPKKGILLIAVSYFTIDYMNAKNKFFAEEKGEQRSDENGEGQRSDL